MLQLDNSSSNARLQFDDVSLPVRRTSHTAINRYRSVAADGQLYIEEIIDPLDKYGGTTTVRGSIRATAKQAAILNYWLPQLPALGHSPSRGLGKVQIEAVPAAKVDNHLPELSERIKKFNQLLRQEWEFYQRVAGIDSLPNDTLYFSVTLLSPTSLTWQGLPATAPHPEMLGFDDKVTLERAFANHHMVGGWHMGAGLPRRTQLVIDMGSVFLYRSEHLSLEALATHLLELEATGLGNRALRQQGLGQIAVCFPFHYQAEVSL
ncbi:MAG: hypothetical protein H3C36_15575 [Chitinophagaceae bacterium]|nr:hypothetical protein [Chitinophagaceae bacterium]